MRQVQKRKFRSAVSALTLAVISIVMFLLALQAWVFFHPRTIEPFRARIRNNKFIMMYENEYNYFLDTGFTTSTLYDSVAQRAHDGVPIFATFSRDATNRRKFHWTYMARRFSADFLEVRNFSFELSDPRLDNISSHFIPKEKRKPLVVIGADMIRQAKWLIDFDGYWLECFPLRTPTEGIPEIAGEPDLTLEYAHALPILGRTYLLETNLWLDGVKIKDVVIDTGYGGELYLEPDDMRRAFPHATGETKEGPIVTPFGKGNIRERKYRIRTATVNGLKVNDLSIRSEGIQRKLIGMGFLKRFKYVLIDPERKRIACYGRDTR